MPKHSFTLPRSFQPAVVLPGRYRAYCDAACWLVHTIVTKMAAKECDFWGCVRIGRDTLVQVMGKHALAIIAALEDAGVIETATQPGEKTIGFRMHKNYWERSHSVPCQNSRLSSRITRLTRRGGL